MAKKAKKARKGLGFSVSQFLRETRAELRKVTWPTRDEAIKLTVVVMVTILVTALFLGILDYVFAKLLGLVI